MLRVCASPLCSGTSPLCWEMSKAETTDDSDTPTAVFGLVRCGDVYKVNFFWMSAITTTFHGKYSW